MQIKDLIRTVPHYPKPGIMFRDITTLIGDAQGLKMTVDQMAKACQDFEFDLIAGIEARGFIAASALSYVFNKGLVPIRKKGKLPAKTIQMSYQLEYGEDMIEIHQDAIKAGQKVLIIDDLLATGGTALAAVELVKKAQGEVVACGFIVDLPELKGRKKLEEAGIEVFALTEFEGH